MKKILSLIFDHKPTTVLDIRSMRFSKRPPSPDIFLNALMTNSDDNSPYQRYIKFPGSRKFKGGIQLSTFVNSLKPLVKSDGEFSKYSLTTITES